ncbi:hypothetical protein ACHAWF_002011, partial [Thalassiosira exigua]
MTRSAAASSSPRRVSAGTWLAAILSISALSNAILISFAGRRTSLDPSAPSAPSRPARERDDGRPRSGRRGERDGRRRRERRPDWRHAVDCSVWDNACLASSHGDVEYDIYPFPLSRRGDGTGRTPPPQLRHAPLSDVPPEWRDALNVVNSLDEPPPRTVGYVYPPEASASERDACMRVSTDLAWEGQLDGLLSSGRVERENATGMVAFSVGDYNYAFDMLHDFHQMNSEVVGFDGSFFLVALDRRTVEMACRYGHPVVAWPSAKPDDVTKLKRAVANTKFEVSSALISREIDFFFYEMDVWFLRSPKPHLASYFSDVDRDVLASSHMNDPMAINIGVYAVRANERTKEYFELCVRMAEESPGTHDQWIMGQLLMLAWIKRTAGGSMKFDRLWKPPPKSNPPEMNFPPRWGLFTTLEIAAGERPLPSARTLAIHPLTEGPLKKPFGKKVLAKELGAWHGFVGSSTQSSSSGGSKLDDDDVAGYYVRRGARRRYLWMDGHDSPSSYNALQSFEWDPMDAESYVVNSASAFRWTVAVLLALARRTGRTFVMPKLIGEEGAHFLWTVLDFEPVEEMGVDFRETNFPHHRRSWRSEEVPYGSVARTALAPLYDVDREGTMYVQHSSSDEVRGSEPERDGTILAWKIVNGTRDEIALDAWWALHTAIPEMDAAELLLVNPHF